MKNESDWVQFFKRTTPRNLQGILGIGDDADGFFYKGRGPIFVTTDAIVEGVDFLPGTPAGLVGRKALGVNLSDLAAMGASPLGFVVTVGIPRGFSQKRVQEAYRGLIALAEKYRVRCLGGDLTRARDFFISVALVGETSGGYVTRAHAKPGDWIGVTGELGGSILGHHLTFEPRLGEGRFLAVSKATAMIDISDGLLHDLGRVLDSSKVGAILEQEAIPVSRAARTLEHALSDGEDFELLFTIPQTRKEQIEKKWKKKFSKTKLTWLGRIRRARGIAWQKNGKPVSAPKIKRTGFDHFSTSV